jgi:hypothetical protein
MIVLNGEWQEIQASINAKDARIKELEKALREIAERDGKIRELEARVWGLRNCWNCKNSDARCHYFEGPVCERWEEEK